MFAKLFFVLCLSLAISFSSESKADNAYNTASQIAQPTAITTSLVTADQTNVSWRGAVIFVNFSAYTSGSFTATIQAKDPISGNYYNIGSSAAITATGLSILKVYPGITSTANVAFSDLLPLTWRVNIVGTTSPIATVSVSAILMP